jgi:murein DD-endopeptidase MepM/ murein hydrolase activator NlpD
MFTVPRLALGVLAAGTLLAGLSVAAFAREPEPVEPYAGAPAPAQTADPRPTIQVVVPLLSSDEAPAAEEGSAEGAIEAPVATPGAEHRALAEDRFSMPLKAWARVTDRYGAARGKGLIHGGIDLALDEHASVYSACEGVVASASYSYAYGNHIVVDCGEGWSTLYGHLSKFNVAAGDAVTRETVIGISGSTGFSTGEHLHFEIRWEGSPVNPEHYLDFKIPPGTPLSSGPIWFGKKPEAEPTPEPTAVPTEVPPTATPTDTPTPTNTPTNTPTPAPPTPTRTPTPRPVFR